MATASQPLTKPRFDLDASVWGFLARELAPTPGRLGAASRSAITAAVMLLIGEACHSEVLFVALFIPLLLPRETPQQTWAAAKGTIITAWAACAASIVLVLLTADLPWARVLALTSAIFACMILSRGLHQPSIAALGPVIAALVLTRLDSVNSAEAAITMGLWVAVMMSAGGLVATAVDFLLPHPGPQHRITQGIVDRLQAAATVLRSCGGTELQRDEMQQVLAQGKLALAGTSSLRKLLPVLSAQPGTGRNYVLRLSAVLNAIDLLSDQAAQLSNPDAAFSEEQKSFACCLAHGCETMADRIQTSCAAGGEDNVVDCSKEVAVQGSAGRLLADMGSQLNDLWTLWSSEGTVPEEKVNPPADKLPKAARRRGPFVTSEDIRFAVKVTLASMACYVIYNGLAWQGINASLLTCFFTADTTIGGTFRKLALRTAGVLVGGLLFGIMGIALITSHLDNVCEFMLYVAVVFFIAGWVAKGSPRIAYAGSQIGISFGLVALLTTVIPTQIVEPRDRLVGVLLGTIVMWLVFTKLWPVDTLALQKQAIAELLRKGSDLILLTIDGSPIPVKRTKARELRESINQGIAKAEDQADLSDYEAADEQAIQTVLRKCLAQTRNVLMLEIAEVDLTIRSAVKVSSWDAFDKGDAQRAAKQLCLLATQVVAGGQEVLARMKQQERQIPTSHNHNGQDADLADQGASDPNKAFLAAKANIQRRRTALLNELLRCVAEMPRAAP